ncbi:MAG: hypothetical protein JST53_14385 [Actinobacteria bacterium]|nr:hypothetical protein [Actinomycetota bacterium]
MRAPGRVAVVAALAGALALTATPALARKPPRRQAPRPNLTVTAEVEGDPFLFYGQAPQKLTITDTVSNQGAGRAGPTLTKVYLEHDHKLWVLGDRAVAALGAGKTDTGNDTLHIDRFPLGAYKLIICTDAKKQESETDESDNCVKLSDPRWFFVAAPRWGGSMSGTQTTVGNGELTERWNSTNASLDFDQYEHGGVFTYLFSGSVIWSDSGTDAAGCSISGSGEDSFKDDAANGQLTVNYLKGDYTTTGLSEESGVTFPLSIHDCPSGHSPAGTSTGPFQRVFWEPSPLGTPVPLPFGSTSLPGSPSSLFNVAWTWNLKLKAPSR